MTIEEIKSKKEKLQIDISTLISKFEKETGANVDIETFRTNFLDGVKSSIGITILVSI